VKFGVSTLGCPSWTVEQAAKAARDYGYHGVELRLLDGEVITPALVEANQTRLRELFGSGSPELIGLGTSVRLSSASDAERIAHERDLETFVDLARDLRVPIVRIFGGRVEDGDVAAAAERIAASLNRVAPRAEKAGVTVAIETHDDFSRSAAVVQVLSRVPSAAIGALWDVHHPYRMGENVAQVWTNLSARLVHVHLKDARRRPDDTWQLVPLGEGEVPAREILRALAMRGYGSYVVAEWEKKWHPELAEPEVAFPHELATMREWVKDLN
jgi:sugar phosphate isomerase/epimerase